MAEERTVFKTSHIFIKTPSKWLPKHPQYRYKWTCPNILHQWRPYFTWRAPLSFFLFSLAATIRGEFVITVAAATAVMLQHSIWSNLLLIGPDWKRSYLVLCFSLNWTRKILYQSSDGGLFQSFICYRNIACWEKKSSYRALPPFYNGYIYSNNTFPTSFSLLPGWLGFLQKNFLLNLGFFVELVEVVDNDGDGEGDAENAADRTHCNGYVYRSCGQKVWSSVVIVMEPADTFRPPLWWLAGSQEE